jgi:hypothetical protein
VSKAAENGIYVDVMLRGLQPAPHSPVGAKNKVNGIGVESIFDDIGLASSRKCRSRRWTHR